MSSAIACRAASLISSGAGKSGKPCARLIAPCATESRVISRITACARVGSWTRGDVRRFYGLNHGDAFGCPPGSVALRLEGSLKAASSATDISAHDRTRRTHTADRSGGSGGALLKGFGAVGFVGGLALIVAGIVNFVHLHDRAGGTACIVMGFVFVLMGRYLWRVRGRPVVELTDDGIIFHADVDPFMRLFTRMGRTVTYRWEHIEAIDVRPRRFGVTIWVYLDAGPERGQRVVPRSRILRPTPRRVWSRR